LLFWLALIFGYGLYAWRQGLTPLGVAHEVVGFMVSSMAGPPVYLALFLARPLVLFPASLLAAAGGFLFGPVSGIVLAAIGCNASASIAYLIGRFLRGGDADPTAQAGVARRYAGRVRENGFEAVLMVQSTYLPFDLVNYLAGFMRVGWGAFALATALGSLPGTVAFVLLGASLRMDFASGAMGVEPRILVASGAVFVVGMVLSRLLRRRGRRKEGSEIEDVEGT